MKKISKKVDQKKNDTQKSHHPESFVVVGDFVVGDFVGCMGGSGFQINHFLFIISI